ncbi:hypothetical protein ACU686_29750 [Yinghuangia aomiensis]
MVLRRKARHLGAEPTRDQVCEAGDNISRYGTKADQAITVDVHIRLQAHRIQPRARPPSTRPRVRAWQHRHPASR